MVLEPHDAAVNPDGARKLSIWSIILSWLIYPWSNQNGQ